MFVNQDRVPGWNVEHVWLKGIARNEFGTFVIISQCARVWQDGTYQFSTIVCIHAHKVC